MTQIDPYGHVFMDSRSRQNRGILATSSGPNGALVFQTTRGDDVRLFPEDLRKLHDLIGRRLQEFDAANTDPQAGEPGPAGVTREELNALIDGRLTVALAVLAGRANYQGGSASGDIDRGVCYLIRDLAEETIDGLRVPRVNEG